MIRRTFLSICLMVLAGTAWAGSLDLSGPFVQGGMIVGKTMPGASATLDGRPLRVSEDGVFVFGLHRDDTGSVALSVVLPDGQTLTRSEAIETRDFDIQRIDGLPPKKVTPPEEVLIRIRREAEAVRAARGRDTPIVAFTDAFLWPVEGRITGIYGSQRILNGQPRQPHYGVDIAAATGTPVAAPAAGVVSFADDDLYFSGGTLMIDHGHGVASTFLHLEDIDVKVGDWVERGARIGTVGETGRATGPHLDWRVNWFEKRLDPQLLQIQKN